eukprot:scaffold5247_cov130-Cylindrotheca_fusiformis.AAC.6
MAGEEKEDAVLTQPTQQQVLQHLQLLQKRMGAMQDWAKGLSDQAQQDRNKIFTLEKQLEAERTSQWGKQQGEGALSRESPVKASYNSSKVTTPRLEQVRREREERENALRLQFTHSAELQREEISPSELSQELESLHEKMEILKAEKQKSQDECSRLTQECQEISKSLEEASAQHASVLQDKDAKIAELQEESEQIEKLIEESYDEREILQEALTQSAEHLKALNTKVKEMAEEVKLLKERNDVLSRELSESRMKEEALLEQLNSSSSQHPSSQPVVQELPSMEEQEQQIELLQSLVKNLEATVAATKKDRDEAISFYKEEMERYYYEIQEEQRQQIEAAKEDEEILLAIEEKFLQGEQHKQLIVDLLQEQEKEILCLQSALADSDERPRGTTLIDEKEDKGKENSTTEDVDEDRESIRQLRSIIGDLQEQLEGAHLLSQEELNKEEIAQLQEENERGKDESVATLKEQVSSLTKELREEQEKRHELEEHLFSNEHPTENAEMIISALKEQRAFLTEELEMEQNEKQEALARLAEIESKINDQEVESPAFAPNNDNDPSANTDWITEVSLLRSEISRLKNAVSDHSQNESYLVPLNASNSHDGYIFQDDPSGDEELEFSVGGELDIVDKEKEPKEKWVKEFRSLRQELGELTEALRESAHNVSIPTAAFICENCNNEYISNDLVEDSPGMPSNTSSDDSSVDSGFGQELLMLRAEVHRQHQGRNMAKDSVLSPTGMSKSPGVSVSSVSSSLSTSIQHSDL